MKTDNIQTQDTINIQNIDRGQMCQSGDKNKQVMLVPSKMEHSAW